MMAYASWSVVFGEQPSAAKWNILGTNDASFNDGTGIANLEIGSGHTSLKNDYKFSVYRNAALTPAGTASLACDTKEFDTGSNVDIVTNKGRFTVAQTGFYDLKVQITGGAAIRALTMIYKNASEFKRGVDFTGGAGGTAGVAHAIVSGAATDFYEPYCNTGSAALTVGSAAFNFFQGHLISQT